MALRVMQRALVRVDLCSSSHLDKVTESFKISDSLKEAVNSVRGDDAFTRFLAAPKPPSKPRKAELLRLLEEACDIEGRRLYRDYDKLPPAPHIHADIHRRYGITKFIDVHFKECANQFHLVVQFAKANGFRGELDRNKLYNFTSNRFEAFATYVHNERDKTTGGDKANPRKA